jgi:O-antigen/teichoic acid export membrane protein
MRSIFSGRRWVPTRQAYAPRAWPTLLAVVVVDQLVVLGWRVLGHGLSAWSAFLIGVVVAVLGVCGRTWWWRRRHPPLSFDEYRRARSRAAPWN